MKQKKKSSNQEDHNQQQEDKVLIQYESPKFTEFNKEALRELNSGENREVKEALFKLIDMAMTDMCNSYLKEGEFKVGGAIFKFEQLKLRIKQVGKPTKKEKRIRKIGE